MMIWPPAGNGNGEKIDTVNVPPVVWVTVYSPAASGHSMPGVSVGVGVPDGVAVDVLVAALVDVAVAVVVAVD
jgi:hypothetical protein